MRKTVLLFSLLLCSGFALAQSHPGVVNFARLGGVDESRVTVDLTLGGWLLSWAQLAASQANDPDLDVLSRVDSVRVRVFEVVDADNTRKTASGLVDELLGQGWERLARVNDEGSWVHILVKGQSDVLEGITVIALDDSQEAVFVNIAGRLNPQDVARLLDDKDLLHVDLDVDWGA